jgi:hypothetical protein
MFRPVFISYSRDASAAHAQSLLARLGALAFLDSRAIDDGDHFPQRLLDGILDACVVVIFATKAYSESRFCRLDMRLALAGGDANGSHLVLALGESCGTVLDAMPAAVANQSWPAANEAEPQLWFLPEVLSYIRFVSRLRSCALQRVQRLGTDCRCR